MPTATGREMGTVALHEGERERVGVGEERKRESGNEPPTRAQLVSTKLEATEIRNDIIRAHVCECVPVCARVCLCVCVCLRLCGVCGWLATAT